MRRMAKRGSVCAALCVLLLFAATPIHAATTLPAGTITNVVLAHTLETVGGVETPVPFSAEDTNLSRASDCILWFDYMVPTGGLVPLTAYEFTVTGPVTEPETVAFTVMGANGLAAATGTAQSSGAATTIRITFTQAAKDAGYLDAGVTGSFYVEASFDADQLANTGKQGVSVTAAGVPSATTTVDFAVTPIECTVSAAKAGALDLVNHRVTWTVTVTPSLKNANTAERLLKTLRVGDVLPAGLSYVSASGSYAGGTVDAADIVFDATAQKLTYTATGNALLASSWPVVLAVVTSYDPDTVALTDGVATFQNTVTAEAVHPQYKKDAVTGAAVEDTEHPGRVQSTSPQAQVQVTGAKLEKIGALQSGSTILWTVKATNSFDRANPQLVDVLPANMTLVANSVMLDGVAYAPPIQRDGGKAHDPYAHGRR